MRTLCVVLAGIFLTPLLKAEGATNTVTEFWPELNLLWQTTTNTRLTVVLASTRDDDVLQLDHWVGVYFDVSVPRFKPLLFRRISDYDSTRTKRIALRVAYRYDHSFHETPVRTEHRPYAEGTLRWVFPKSILASDRNRLELRFQNTGFSWRYRNRLTIEKDLRIGGRPVTPYISTEAYYDSRYAAWDQFRFSGGGIVAVGKLFSIEPYYTRQISTVGHPRNVNGLGLRVGIHLRR
jgi:hypothetical protein